MRTEADEHSRIVRGRSRGILTICVTAGAHRSGALAAATENISHLVLHFLYTEL